MTYEWILLNVWWDKGDGTAWQKSCGASKKWLTYNRKIKNALTFCFFPFKRLLCFVRDKMEVLGGLNQNTTPFCSGIEREKKKEGLTCFFFLNEWKWPTLWACMNLNEVTKGILCNSVLFDLETAPVLIPSRTGGWMCTLGLRGGLLQPAMGQRDSVADRQRCLWVRRVRMRT